MIQKYTFFDGGTIEFDDSKTVKELIEYAFKIFNYYEPMGMDIVTLFQARHPNTNNGWFTTDITRRCCDEILSRDCLCFAYYMPGVFCFAEGGWGQNLGNCPEIPNAIALELRFRDFSNLITINADYTFSDIVHKLQKCEYVSADCRFVRVIPIGVGRSYLIDLADPIINSPLSALVKDIKKYHSKNLSLDNAEHIHHTIYELN